MRIDQATFVISDTETTGSRAGEDRLIEIAAVRMQGGEVVDRFSALINPQRHIPHRITELTGITTAMVFSEPGAAEVLARFRAFLGEGILVAHNLRFDRGFIDAELERAGLPPLDNPGLCTLRLARRLLPELPSKGLDALAAHYGIIVPGRHRAAGDAEATTLLLQHLLRLLAHAFGIETTEQLLNVQHRRYSETKPEAPHLQQIRTEVVPLIPERPGVYFMKNGRGDLLYIGKAKNLRNRVRSYFTAVDAHEKRIKDLVRSIRRVEWTETGSELGALLLESRLIKEHQPRFNRADRRYRNHPFIRLDAAENFPRVSVTSLIRNDGAEYYGPISRRKRAEQVLEIINRVFRLRLCDDHTFARRQPCLYASIERCDAPCTNEAGAAAYPAEVQRVRDFLTGQSDEVHARIAVAMQEASARMEFEQAGWFRDQLRFLERMRIRQKFVAAAVHDHHGVLVQPGIEEGTIQLFVVRSGRLTDTITVPTAYGREEAEALRGRLSAYFESERFVPERYHKAEVDEIRLLAQWMYVHRSSTRQVRWWPGRLFDAWFDELLAVLGASAPEPG